MKRTVSFPGLVFIRCTRQGPDAYSGSFGGLTTRGLDLAGGADFDARGCRENSRLLCGEPGGGWP